MPPKIAHDDGFEIWLSHQNEGLTIYDSVDVSDSSVQEGHFAGVLNKTFIQRKASAELIMMQLVILRDFDFFSGDAVQFKLEIVTANGGKEQVLLDPILKKTHEKKPKDPTGLSWFPVLLSTAPRGTVSVSVTRGTKDENTGEFTPLSGEGGEPYIVQIEWRQVESQSSIGDSTKRGVTRGMQKVSATPPPVSRKRPPKTAKLEETRSTEESGDSSSAGKSTEPERAKTTSKRIPSEDQENNIGPTVEPTADSQTQAAGDTDSSQDPSLPIRLRDEVNLSQSEDAPGGEGVEGFTTPPATFSGSGKTPPGTGGAPEGSTIGSTLTLAHEANEIAAPSRKRSAGEAFESDRERDLIRLAFEVDMARADFDVDDARVQEMPDSTSSKYFSLLLKRAKSHLDVVDAELKLEKAHLEGKKDAKYRELKMRKAEAQLAVLDAEEKTLEEEKRPSLEFKVRKACAEFGVAKARVKQMGHGGCRDDVEYFRAVLKRAEANSGVALAEFERKAAECGDDKDFEYFGLQTRKAEAHREAVQAQRSVLLKTGAL
jgi:hypothetical protein